MTSKKIALIPARKGSQRLPRKNVIPLSGHPLIAYTITCALESGVFDRVCVSTNCEEIATVASHYGAEVPELRPDPISQSLSPDFEWVSRMVEVVLGLADQDLVAILRPTNPLRNPNTLRNAMQVFEDTFNFDSLRAIRQVTEHPSKMWRANENLEIFPFDNRMNPISEAPNHSSPFQLLEELWIQDASLEITKVGVIRESKTISGTRIMGFRMPGHEGFDINTPSDLAYLEYLIKNNPKMIRSLKCAAHHGE